MKCPFGKSWVAVGGDVFYSVDDVGGFVFDGKHRNRMCREANL